MSAPPQFLDNHSRPTPAAGQPQTLQRTCTGIILDGSMISPIRCDGARHVHRCAAAIRDGRRTHAFPFPQHPRSECCSGRTLGLSELKPNPFGCAHAANAPNPAIRSCCSERLLAALPVKTSQSAQTCRSPEHLGAAAQPVIPDLRLLRGNQRVSLTELAWTERRLANRSIFNGSRIHLWTPPLGRVDFVLLR